MNFFLVSCSINHLMTSLMYLVTLWEVGNLNLMSNCIKSTLKQAPPWPTHFFCRTSTFTFVNCAFRYIMQLILVFQKNFGFSAFYSSNTWIYLLRLITLKVQSHFGYPNIYFAIMLYTEIGSKGSLPSGPSYKLCNKVDVSIMSGRKWKQCADRKEFPTAERAGKRKYLDTWHCLISAPLPQAVPRVDLAIIQVVLFASVEHKLPFMGPIFLWKTRWDMRSRQSCCDRLVLRILQSGSESETVFMSDDKGAWKTLKKCCFVFVIDMPLTVSVSLSNLLKKIRTKT